MTRNQTARRKQLFETIVIRYSYVKKLNGSVIDNIHQYYM